MFVWGFVSDFGRELHVRTFSVFGAHEQSVFRNQTIARSGAAFGVTSTELMSEKQRTGAEIREQKDHAENGR